MASCDEERDYRLVGIEQYVITLTEWLHAIRLKTVLQTGQLTTVGQTTV